MSNLNKLKGRLEKIQEEVERSESHEKEVIGHLERIRISVDVVEEWIEDLAVEFSSKDLFGVEDTQRQLDEIRRRTDKIQELVRRNN